jgi:hypothetical protein
MVPIVPFHDRNRWTAQSVALLIRGTTRASGSRSKASVTNDGGFLLCLRPVPAALCWEPRIAPCVVTVRDPEAPPPFPPGVGGRSPRLCRRGLLSWSELAGTARAAGETGN